MLNELNDTAETDPDNYTGPPRVDRKTGKIKCKNGKEPDDEGKCPKDADFHNATPPKNPLHQEALDFLSQKEDCMDKLFDKKELKEASEASSPAKSKTSLLPKKTGKVGSSVVYDHSGKEVKRYNGTASGAALAASHSSKIGGKMKYHDEATNTYKELTQKDIIEMYLAENSKPIEESVVAAGKYTNEVNLVTELNTTYTTPVLSNEYLALGLVNEKPKTKENIKESFTMASSMEIYYKSLSDNNLEEHQAKPINIGKPFSKVTEDKPVETETQGEKIIKDMLSNKIAIW